MQSANPTLASLLGLSPTPDNLLEWHSRIVEGFPAQSIKALASATGLTASAISAVAGVRSSSKKDLSQEASNILYRIAALWVSLQPLFKGDNLRTTKWLTSPHAGMRGRVPLQLLGSSIGYDYASAAAARDQA